MSTENPVKPKTEKTRLLRRVGQELGRELTTSNLFLHTLIAAQLGLSATDTRCLEILARHAPAPMTAGALTEATGLTTGAITGIIDRLEQAGFVKRLRDPEDRRKVFVSLLRGHAGKLTTLYAGLGSRMEQLASRYTLAELRVIEDFLEKNLEILNAEIAQLSSKTPAKS